MRAGGSPTDGGADAAASGATAAEPVAGEPPELETFMTSSDVQALGEEQKEELRQIKARQGVQPHFSDFKWDAASGASLLQDWLRAVNDAQARANIYTQLPSLADPIPSPEEFISGIPHKSSNPSASGELWPVLRAMHSRKMHYLTRLAQKVDEGPKKKLATCWPDTSPASGGLAMYPLSVENQRNMGESWKIKKNSDYLKHLLALHDGEVRRVGWTMSTPFAASGGNLQKACFWQYQFCNQVVASNQDIPKAVFHYFEGGGVREYFANCWAQDWGRRGREGERGEDGALLDFSAYQAQPLAGVRKTKKVCFDWNA